jgi:hypothetical protein
VHVLVESDERDGSQIALPRKRWRARALEKLTDGSRPRTSAALLDELATEDDSARKRIVRRRPSYVTANRDDLKPMYSDVGCATSPTRGCARLEPPASRHAASRER